MSGNSRPIQIKNSIDKFDFCDSELVIGVVCAVGTDYGPIRDSIVRILQKFSYTSQIVRISDLIPRFTEGALSNGPEIERIDSRMTAGNSVCRLKGRKDFWALAAIAEINAARHRDTFGSEPQPRTAHIILTLKRPQEVATLRKVYGDGFFLIGVFATERERLDYLIERNAPKDRAIELIKRDAEEATDEYGQHTRETFHLSDVFVQFRGSAYQKELDRFFSLVFSNPYITPTQQEQAMFLSYSASLRSAQLGRQVGAAITSKYGDVLSVGCNDVPRPGGGLYWPGDLDNRDHVRGEDTNDKQREKIINQLLAAVTEVDVSRAVQIESIMHAALENSSVDRQKIIDQVQTKLSELGSLDNALRLPFRRMLDITEYGRAVHAEMDALLTCARSGVSPSGAILYTTTFPCHNCTRHIIAAGIERVFYIEPYAKSKAEELHEDEIVVEEKLDRNRGRGRRVPFTHFVGIGPRRYFDLFSLALSTGHELIRKKDGGILDVNEAQAWTRIPLCPFSYLEKEEIAVEQLDAAYSPQLDMFDQKE
jgi:deoxycytidylate deaminase